jgi:hypothetical protein
MLRKLSLVVLALTAVMFVMVACGNGNNNQPIATPQPQDTGAATPAPPTPEPTPPPQEVITAEEVENDPFGVLNTIMEQFNDTVVNDNAIIEGGTLRWGLGTTATFPGIFCPVHWLSSLDNDLRNLFFEPLVQAGIDFTPVNDRNLANVYFDRDARTVTFVKMHESFLA